MLDMTPEELSALVADGRPENKTLEYKRELPGASDGQKVEFLGDISAFANTAGGRLIYGIDEQRDDDGHPTGKPGAIAPLDAKNIEADKQRLEQILADGVEPRIPGVHFYVVQAPAADGYVLVIDVPRSWNAPHMVVYGGRQRFFGRRATGKYLLDVREIREAFQLGANTSRRIADFRRTRLTAIAGDETPTHLPRARRLVVHVCPIQSFETEPSIDLAGVDDWLQLNGFPEIRTPYTFYNFDGLVAQDQKGPPQTYAIVFRSGVIEWVSTRSLWWTGAEKLLPLEGAQARIHDVVHQALRLLSEAEVLAPYYACVTLLGVRGCSANTPDGVESARPIDRDVLDLPPALIQSVNSNLPHALQPALDVAWQATGVSKAPPIRPH